jgi:hypothetical protein
MWSRDRNWIFLNGRTRGIFVVRSTSIGMGWPAACIAQKVLADTLDMLNAIGTRIRAERQSRLRRKVVRRAASIFT